jgi:hypothetical protein
LLESLDRPLGLLAARSVLSLQASSDIRNPRLFLFSGDLVMAVIPAGTGRELLEMSVLSSETRSLKAELKFPVTSPIAPADPYDQIRDGKFTICAGCHRDESPSTRVTIAEGFETDVLRPPPTEEYDLEFARSQYLACDPKQDPERCAMLAAIFGHGEVQPRRFSNSAHTIYDYPPFDGGTGSQ